jgi:S1-C subfamily serine protease
MRHRVQGLQSSYQSETSGTAFLITSAGRAITNSHVVDLVRRRPATYKLVAIVGNEFYSARLICASVLPEEVNGGVTPSRDIAEIQLTPWDIDADDLTVRGVGKPLVHRGALPLFPALTLGNAPEPGDSVRVLGYGHQDNAIIPYEWSASGAVREIGLVRDGTPVFGIKFDRAAEHGHSGSPVLNMKGEAVGLFSWLSPKDPTVGYAIGRDALSPACPREGEGPQTPR